MTEEEENNLLERIYNGRINGDFDPLYFNQLADGLIDQLNSNWPAPKDMDYNSPDHLSKTLMELNLYRFSAIKDTALMQQANALLRSSKSFDEFKQAVTPLMDDYNVNYLRTEYETARATGQSTANYLRNLEVVEDFPYWEYQTIGDDRVRPSHEALDGVLFRAGEVGSFNPPNGYNCRCEFVPRSSKGGKVVSSEEDAKELIGEEYNKMAKAGFADNRATNGYVFNDSQMYLDKFSETKLGYQNFDLEAYDKINPKAPTAKTTDRTKEEAEAWFEEQVGKNDLEDNKAIRLLDYNGRPIELSRDKLLKNKNWEALDLVTNSLSNPDEVYFVRKNKGYNLTLIQYYKDKPMVINITSDTKGASIKNWSFIDSSNIDKARKGLFIKTK